MKATDNMKAMRHAPSRPALRWLRYSRQPALACLALLSIQGCARPFATPELSVPGIEPSVTTSAVMQEAPPVQPQSQPAQTAGCAKPAPITGLPEVFAAAEQDPVAHAPSIASANESTDGYHTIGGILAEVNGQPIFSDDLILSARNMLRAAAKQQPTLQSFLREAKMVLERELKARIENHLIRVVAERNLSAKDRRTAVLAATQFRSNRVTAAGGSEARARELALEEEGMSLEKLVEDQEHLFLASIFFRKVVLPRARPSEAEIREYYQRHPEVYSSQGKGQVEFLLIELSAAGGTQEQLEVRAQHVHKLAAAGEDFAELARQYNDNAVYKENAGAVPGMPLGRGDFRWPAVDEAVWNTAEGQVSPIITEDNGQRRFIAKITRRTEPQSVTFEQAQGRIREVIQNQRRIQLMQQYLLEARQYAAVTPVEQIERNLQTALEVVSQQYEDWRRE